MLDNTIQYIDALADDAEHWHCLTLLDANAIDKFIEWLRANPIYTARLVDKKWRIGVLRHHIQMRPDARQMFRRLKAFQIEPIRYDSAKQRPFVAELQRAYFDNDADSDQTAELLAYGRTQSTDRKPIRVISRYQALRLVPHIALYQLPATDDVGNDSNAVFLRMFERLKIHPEVDRAAKRRYENGDFAIAVSEATKMLIHEVRKIGNEHHLPYVSEINDRPMVNKAFKTDAPGEPHIRLNNFITSSERNEQQGYRDIIYGVVGAVRNPTAHAPADDAFIQERFGDRHTALKFLCLLSLLFEKLEQRKAPLP